MNEYWAPLIGGVVIGLSSSTMLGGLGRITGISGITTALYEWPKKENLWRYSFLLGLLSGGLILMWTQPQLFDYSLESSFIKIISAGLLVGIGTRMGGGCTSGHGVCGLPRLAKRSMVATLTFILFGVITVAVERLFL